MNSLIGLFCIEALGFGRGLGALDLSTTRAKRQLHMLDPSQLDDQQQQEVLDAFAPLLDRPIGPLPSELERDDRRAFDRAVLDAFGLRDQETAIRDALKQLFEIRMAVNA